MVVLGQKLDSLGAQESYLGQAILCSSREAHRLYRPQDTASPQEKAIEDTLRVYSNKAREKLYDKEETG